MTPNAPTPIKSFLSKALLAGDWRSRGGEGGGGEVEEEEEEEKVGGKTRDR